MELIEELFYDWTSCTNRLNPRLILLCWRSTSTQDLIVWMILSNIFVFSASKDLHWRSDLYTTQAATGLLLSNCLSSTRHLMSTSWFSCDRADNDRLYFEWLHKWFTKYCFNLFNWHVWEFIFQMMFTCCLSVRDLCLVKRETRGSGSWK